MGVRTLRKILFLAGALLLAGCAGPSTYAVRGQSWAPALGGKITVRLVKRVHRVDIQLENLPPDTADQWAVFWATTPGRELPKAARVKFDGKVYGARGWFTLRRRPTRITATLESDPNVTTPGTRLILDQLIQPD